MTALLYHVGPDDAFSPAFRRKLAAAAGVEVEFLVEIRHLAARVLAAEPPTLSLAPGTACWIGCRRPRAVRALLAHAARQIRDHLLDQRAQIVRRIVLANDPTHHDPIGEMIA